MKNSNHRGRWAEQLAENWLIQCGLSLHTKNYNRRLGEIDLVLRDELSNTWVFVEVKYRKRGAKVSGIESVTWQKQRRLRRTAALFLQGAGDQDSAARIDVVAITEHDDQIRAEFDDGHVHAVIGSHHLLWIKNAIEGAST